MDTMESVLRLMEQRFKIVSSLAGDISKYPVYKEDDVHFATDKEKARSFAEVFTPLYMVDEMLNVIPDGGMDLESTQLDLCSGYGQFTVRMLRKFYETYGEEFNIKKYLLYKHYFSELQISSCYKLLWTFSTHINLAIGDCLHLSKLPRNWRGIWHYVEAIDSWVEVTGFVKALKKKVSGRCTDYKLEHEQDFVRAYESFVSRLEVTAKEYKMSIKKIISTKTGRKKLLDLINKAADGVELNWQDKDTPEWIIKEMVSAVPDVESLKKILVLFNVEFLEELVRQRGIDPKKIEFGYDSEIEGLYAEAVYKVRTFSVGKSLDTLKESTKDKSGVYDVVFSNPPYQIQSEDQKDRTGGGSKQAKPIYHEIVTYAIDGLQPRYVCMITPSRWMVGGMGLKDYRKRMLSDKRVRLIQDFPGAFDVFPTVKIESGVSYFLWDKDYTNGCEFNGIPRDLGEFDVVVRDNTSAQILKKVLAKHPVGQFCNKLVLPNKPFGLPTNFKGWISPAPQTVPCVLRNREERYVSFGVFTDNYGIQNKWKVGTPAAYGEDTSIGSPQYVVKGSFILEPGKICTETYIILGSFKTKKEAEAYLAFTQTKFYRFTVSLRKASQHINTQKFAWVPDLGDYSKTWTDAELYQHFGLTRKEIEHIEKSIKAL